MLLQIVLPSYNWSASTMNWLFGMWCFSISIRLMAPFGLLKLGWIGWKNCSGWIVVREKHCSGWKNKLNSADYKVSRTEPLLNSLLENVILRCITSLTELDTPCERREKWGKYQAANKIFNGDCNWNKKLMNSNKVKSDRHRPNILFIWSFGKILYRKVQLQWIIHTDRGCVAWTTTVKAIDKRS